MSGIIYCLTSPSEKKYIGQTKYSLERRFTQHCRLKGECRLLENSINKYGPENFKKEILYTCELDEIDEKEKYFISLHNSMHPNGYNIRSGGKSQSYHCEESKELMRQQKLGEKNPNFGKPRDDETKKKISEAKKGEKHHFYNKKFTDEHKLKCAQAHRKNEEDLTLPMYLIKVKERPSNYTSEGFAIVNHPRIKNKYFTSKKLTMDEKYRLSIDYLNNEMEKLNIITHE